MHEYMVSLDLITASNVTSVQVATVVGVSEAKLNGRKTRQGMQWSLESGVSERGMLSEHLEALASMLSMSITSEIIEKIYLVIGVLYETFTCTVNFPHEPLALIASKCPGLQVEIACYPSEED